MMAERGIMREHGESCESTNSQTSNRSTSAPPMDRPLFTPPTDQIPNQQADVQSLEVELNAAKLKAEIAEKVRVESKVR